MATELRIVKVQLPLGASHPAILVYDQAREFEAFVTDPEECWEIARSQDYALRCFWRAELNMTAKTFTLIEVWPEQGW